MMPLRNFGARPTPRKSSSHMGNQRLMGRMANTKQMKTRSASFLTSRVPVFRQRNLNPPAPTFAKGAEVGSRVWPATRPHVSRRASGVRTKP